MNWKYLHLLLLSGMALGIAATPAIAQKNSKKTKESAAVIAEPLEVRTARIDSIVGSMEASLESFSLQTADRNDGSNTEKVYAYFAKEADPESMTVVRNEMANDNGKTQNHFYLQEGKVMCWTLYREETTRQSPRPRKRFTKYYLENGVIFHTVERAVSVTEDIETATFAAVPVTDATSMTEFMTRKFQNVLDAFRQGWKATVGQ